MFVAGGWLLNVLVAGGGADVADSYARRLQALDDEVARMNAQRVAETRYMTQRLLENGADPALANHQIALSQLEADLYMKMQRVKEELIERDREREQEKYQFQKEMEDVYDRKFQDLKRKEMELEHDKALFEHDLRKQYEQMFEKTVSDESKHIVRAQEHFLREKEEEARRREEQLQQRLQEIARELKERERQREAELQQHKLLLQQQLDAKLRTLRSKEQEIENEKRLFESELREMYESEYAKKLMMVNQDNMEKQEQYLNERDRRFSEERAELMANVKKLENDLIERDRQREAEVAHLRHALQREYDSKVTALRNDKIKAENANLQFEVELRSRFEKEFQDRLATATEGNRTEQQQFLREREKDALEREREIALRLQKLQAEYSQRDHEREMEVTQYKRELDEAYQQKLGHIRKLQQELHKEKAEFERDLRSRLSDELKDDADMLIKERDNLQRAESEAANRIQRLKEQHRQATYSREQSFNKKEQELVDQLHSAESALQQEFLERDHQRDLELSKIKRDLEEEHNRRLEALKKAELALEQDKLRFEKGLRRQFRDEMDETYAVVENQKSEMADAQREEHQRLLQSVARKENFIRERHQALDRREQELAERSRLIEDEYTKRDDARQQEKQAFKEELDRAYQRKVDVLRKREAQMLSERAQYERQLREQYEQELEVSTAFLNNKQVELDEYEVEQQKRFEKIVAQHKQQMAARERSYQERERALHSELEKAKDDLEEQYIRREYEREVGRTLTLGNCTLTIGVCRRRRVNTRLNWIGNIRGSWISFSKRRVTSALSGRMRKSRFKNASNRSFMQSKRC